MSTEKISSDDNIRPTKRLSKALYYVMLLTGGIFVGIIAVDLESIFFSSSSAGIDVSIRFPDDFIFDSESRALEATLACPTSGGRVSSYTVVTSVSIDDHYLETLWWPVRIIYAKDAENGSVVSEGTFVRIPKDLLTEGNHKIRIKSTQRQGKFIVRGKVLCRIDQTFDIVVEGNDITIAP